MNASALAPRHQSPATVPNDSAWLDASIYPFEPRPFEFEGFTMSYLDEGQGRPILFVHGTPSWSFEWRHAIGALSPRYRCVALDHLGFGLSDKPKRAAYEPSDHAQRLSAFVRQLDLNDITLVVHDFGVPIGLAVALDHPERIASIVVLNGWLWDHGTDPRIRRLSRLVASPLGKLLYLGLNASARWLVPASFADKTKLTRNVHEHYTRPFRRWSERFGPWTLGRALAGSGAWYASLWERREILSRLSLSFVWGMKDPAFDATYLDRFREAFPQAEVWRLSESGHFPQEEEPERVTEAIRRAAALPGARV